MLLPPNTGFPTYLMLGAFAVYCFVFPFALLLLSFDWMPFGMEWMSSLLLAMLGLCSAGWLWTNYGRVGLLLGAFIFALGVALEYIGVLTGVPFGSYSYTGVLAPELPGGVPLAIGFAWLFIVVCCLFTARWLVMARRERTGLPPYGFAVLRSCILGAILAVGLDLLLEPVAFHVKNYWVWLPLPGNGGYSYYGIPWSNFASWLVAALLMNLLVARLISLRRWRSWGWLPVALFVMNAVMFGVVNLAHGYWVAGAVGLALVGVIGVRMGMARAHGRS